jgi:hypothetical protein
VLLLRVLLLFLAFPALADEAVVVTGLRNPVDKSYRKMVKGMDLFEQEHAIAPQAELRYRLLARKRETNMQGVELAIVADTFELPVPLRADNTFVLERNRAALREDASVRPNRKVDTMTWRADVRTPGLPSNTRRLGDLRLECMVGMESALVSRYPSLLDRMVDMLEDPRQFCSRANVPYLYFADRPLFSVTLSTGSRQQTLSIDQLYGQVGKDRDPTGALRHCDCEALLDRTFILPLGDGSWPDDTLVRFEYMESVSFEGSTKADLFKSFGEGKAFRFANGYEIRAYQFDDTEFVALLDSAGRVAKTRLRK